jgi:hypothetical protein
MREDSECVHGMEYGCSICSGKTFGDQPSKRPDSDTGPSTKATVPSATYHRRASGVPEVGPGALPAVIGDRT